MKWCWTPNVSMAAGRARWMSSVRSVSTLSMVMGSTTVFPAETEAPNCAGMVKIPITLPAARCFSAEAMLIGSNRKEWWSLLRSRTNDAAIGL